MTANNERADWWKQAVVYQVYPRSFKDSDGDGLGDIAGVSEKMDYLRALGVDAVWLSPFYPSELADGGYDVIDYRDVDPRLGTMDDFDEMTLRAHEAGIKVIVDIVPNHTANKHRMFLEALAAGRGSKERDRYIFREGRGENGELPPNDWISLFGGPAWERVEDGQWYLHIFTKEQPDLNWKNPEVHEEFKKTLRFWSDHGTDGFRIDVAHGLAKDLECMPLEEMGKRYPIHESLCHDGTNPIWDRFEVHDIYREWREVFNEYDPPRLPRRAGTGVQFRVRRSQLERRRDAYRHRGGLGFSHTFRRLHHHVGHEQPRCTASCQPLRPASDQDPQSSSGSQGLVAARRHLLY